MLLGAYEAGVEDPWGSGGYGRRCAMPIEPSGPVVVGVGGSVQSPFGLQPLGYHDSLINPLSINGTIGVKSWVAPTASDETGQQLIVQQLQLP